MSNFTYDPKIDMWSHKKVKGLYGMWGGQFKRETKSMPQANIEQASLLLNKFLNSHGQGIISKLNHIFGLNFKLEDFGFYLNTLPEISLDSHKKGNFFISISSSHPAKKFPMVVVHEFSHIYFYAFMHKNFKKSWLGLELHVGDKRLGEGELNELKEIVTVINNIEFKDILITPDTGYPKHEKIRTKTVELWQGNKNFKDFIIQLTELYKEKWNTKY